jgi:hypothetical protein
MAHQRAGLWNCVFDAKSEATTGEVKIVGREEVAERMHHAGFDQRLPAL